jgi:hypothetical protein
LNANIRPVRIVAFNTAEGWSSDVSEEIATELAQACADRGETPPSIADFVVDHTGQPQWAYDLTGKQQRRVHGCERDAGRSSGTLPCRYSNANRA